MMDQSQHLQLLSTKKRFANVSSSFLLYSNGHSLSEAVDSICSLFLEMDDAKRRALIKAQAAKKKESSDVAPLAMVAINPSIKRKSAP